MQTPALIVPVANFVPQPAAPTVTPFLAGVGTVTVVAKALLVDTDYFTIDDDENPPVLFEFDSAGNGVTGGRRQVNVSTDTTATHVRDRLITAINAARDLSLLNLTATATGAAEVTVTMNDETAGGTLTENVADAGFLVAGMAAPTQVGGYTYKLVGIAANGSATEASAGTPIVNGPTALDATHLNRVTWTDDPLNAVSVQVWRTAGGPTQGLIGTVAAGIKTFDDDGDVGNGATAPTSNLTGVGNSIGVGHLRDLTLQVVGTFVATLQPEGKLDGEDGNAEYKAIGGTLNATSLAALGTNLAISQFRLRMTAYTSGTVKAYIGGHIH